MVDVELAILDREEGVDHVLWHVADRDRLAVLDLERPDLDHFGPMVRPDVVAELIADYLADYLAEH